MKSKNKKRIVALMLCMVMALSGSVSAFAEEANTENVNSEGNVQEVQEKPETSDPEMKPETSSVAEPSTSEVPVASEKASGEETSGAEQQAYSASYENEDVILKVSAKEGIVPEGAELSVTPIEKKEITSNMTAEEKKKAEKINKQHEVTEQKLQEDSEKKENTLEGFLAYDIGFLVNGQEVEPNGDVTVTMNFKKAVLPEGMDTEIAKEAEVSIMHLEENKDGTVKEVVDMGKQNKVKTMKTTEEKKVQKAEFTTDSFSVYTITWKSSNNSSRNSTIYIHYVDENGKELNGKTGSGNFTLDDNWQDVSLWADSISGYEYSRAYVLGQNNSKNPAMYVYRKYNSRNDIIVKYRNDISSNGQNWSEVSANVNGQNKSGYHLYLVYTPESTTPPSTGGGSSATGNLAHRKWVEDNGDGTYDLTLNVTGAVGTETNPAKVDVVLIMDVSLSMQGDNLTAAKGAVQTLTNALNTNNIDSRWKLVTFGIDANIVTSNWENRTTVNNRVQNIADLQAGTNYEAGLKSGATAINSARADAEKIVIFLTDGQPNYYVDDRGNNVGTGGQNTTTNAYNGALRGGVAISCDRFYAVGMGLPANAGNGMSGLTILQNVTGKVTANTKSAVNVTNTNLSDIFANIAEDINTFVASNVTITDTLTPEVDLVQAEINGTLDNNLRVKVTDNNGNEVTESEVQAGGIVARYENKVLTLDFNDNYELKDGYTYSVTATIKPNEAAVNKYIQNGYEYPHTGETDTGVSSAGKGGIFSNVEGSANVTWDRKDNNGVQSHETGAYNRPVVQLPTKVDLDLIKTSQNTDAQIDGAEFKVYKGIDQTVNDKVVIDWNGKTQIGDTITINQSNTTPELKGLETGYYELVETKSPAGYSILSNSIYFKVKDGMITLCDKDGKAIESSQEMWQLDISNGNVLTIKNEILYELPDSGGSGIYWYMISGMLLMIAAALILYKDRCKEVLRR